MTFEGRMSVQLPSGHTAEEISVQEKEEQIRDFEAFRKIYEANEYLVRLHPKGWLLSSAILRYSDKIFNFKFNADDILVMTHPKNGTNWVSEIVWTMLSNNINTVSQDSFESVRKKVRLLEMDLFFLETTLKYGNPLVKEFKKRCPGRDEKDGVSLQILQSIQGPRIMKTHLPFSLYDKTLIDTCKVIYGLRNPKDVVVSYFHNCRLYVMFGYVGTFNRFFDCFLEDKTLFGPYWAHAKEAWALKDHPNMLFLFYEDLKKNTKEEYARISNFLKANLSLSEMEKIIEYTSFPVMKKRDEADFEFEKSFYNPEVIKADGGFYRKGEVGSWKCQLTAEQEARIDLWIKRNAEGTGLHFD